MHVVVAFDHKVFGCKIRHFSVYVIICLFVASFYLFGFYLVFINVFEILFLN